MISAKAGKTVIDLDNKDDIRYKADCCVLYIYFQLASLVPRQEYIHRAPYGAIDGLRLHAIHHA